MKSVFILMIIAIALMSCSCGSKTGYSYVKNKQTGYTQVYDKKGNLICEFNQSTCSVCHNE